MDFNTEGWRCFINWYDGSLIGSRSLKKRPQLFTNPWPDVLCHCGIYCTWIRYSGCWSGCGDALKKVAEGISANRFLCRRRWRLHLSGLYWILTFAFHHRWNAWSTRPKSWWMWATLIVPSGFSQLPNWRSWIGQTGIHLSINLPSVFIQKL